MLKYLTLTDLVIFTNYIEFSLITKDYDGKITSLKDVKLSDTLQNKKPCVVAGEDKKLELLFKDLYKKLIFKTVFSNFRAIFFI